MLALSGAVQAEIYKCVGEGGKVTFSDLPCGKSAAKEVKVDSTKPAQSPAAKNKEGKKRGGYGRFIDRSREVDKAAKPGK